MTGYLPDTKGDASFARKGWLVMIRAVALFSTEGQACKLWRFPFYQLVLSKRSSFAMILDFLKTDTVVNDGSTSAPTD